MKPSLACFIYFFLQGVLDFTTPSFCTAQQIQVDSLGTSYFNYRYESFFLNEPFYLLKPLASPVKTQPVRLLQADLGIHPYNPLLALPETEKDSAYSYIRYLKGSKQEEGFAAGFSQRLFKQFVLEADFRSLNSPGFFINQASKALNYHAGLAYQSRKGTYSAKVSYLPFKLNAGQNGGILADSLLSTISNNEGKALPVNLETDALIYRNKLLSFSQQLHLNLSSDTNDRRHSLLTFRHEGNFKREHFQYSSTTANHDFYISSYFDTVATNDSTVFTSLSNFLTPLFEFRRAKSRFGAGPVLGAEEIKYDLPGFQLVSSTYSGGLSAFLSLGDYSFSGKYLMQRNEFYEKGYDAELVINLDRFYAANDLQFSVSRASMFPSLMSEHYLSNHFRWNNNFSNTIKTDLSFSVSLSGKKASLKAGFSSLDNHIYYNEAALPVQYGGSINIIKVTGELNIPLYRSLKMHSRMKFETADREELYRVPEFYTYSAIYIERFLFKNALLTSFGAGLLYFSSYRADAFMPATAQFYLQNETAIGNYPFADVFLNFQIKSARFFIRAEHVNWKQSDEYFYLPHHPSPGRTLKVGLSWTFNEIQVSRR